MFLLLSLISNGLTITLMPCHQVQVLYMNVNQNENDYIQVEKWTVQVKNIVVWCLWHSCDSGLWMEVRPEVFLKGGGVWISYNIARKSIPVPYCSRVKTVLIYWCIALGLHDVYCMTVSGRSGWGISAAMWWYMILWKRMSRFTVLLISNVGQFKELRIDVIEPGW